MGIPEPLLGSQVGNSEIILDLHQVPTRWQQRVPVGSSALETPCKNPSWRFLTIAPSFENPRVLDHPPRRVAWDSLEGDRMNG